MTFTIKSIWGTLYLLFALCTMALAQEQSNVKQLQPKGRNIISCDDYGAIKYEGYTTNELEATNGDSVALTKLIGPPTSVDNSNRIIGAVAYYYNSNKISFRESELTGIEIKDSSWPVTILGTEIGVGNSFTYLRKHLGHDLKITAALNYPSSFYTVSFNCSMNETSGMNITFNNYNRIIEIAYFVFT